MTFSLQPDTLDRDCVLEFFWAFSVFECALKRNGYLKSGRYCAASPDWHKFGCTSVGRFKDVTVPCFQESVESLKKLKPKRQVVRDKKDISWEPVSMRGISDEQYVIELLKTVRNNLFHGGKYPDGPVEEIARNREILRASLVVLAGFYHLLKVQPPFLLNASDCLGNAEFPDSL